MFINQATNIKLVPNKHRFGAYHLSQESRPTQPGGPAHEPNSSSQPILYIVNLNDNPNVKFT